MNPTFERFTWRGEPIFDIEAWAKERGERMVNYHAQRETPYGTEEYQGSMPESFWNHLLMRDGWHYTEIKETDESKM